MFETLIVQPILNLLTFIYAILPGNDFGVAVIVFTIVVRMAMWPLLKKQLHQSRKIRELQPEIKKIKSKTKGDKQKEGQLLMELYKEKGVNPFGSFGLLLVQMPVLIGLFQGLRKIAVDKNAILDLSYSWVKELGHMKEIALDINEFDPSLMGIDLTSSAFSDAGTYMPILIIAILAAVFQFFQTKAMQPDSDDKRTIREILKDEAKGNKADQAEINAAMGRNMKYFFPILTFVFASRVPGALALYWATGALVGIIQQRNVLNRDVDEMEELNDDSDDKSNNDKSANQPKKPKKKKSPKANKSKGRKK
jgi:YidC/Oxa1 family membrane protein insertase